MFFQISEYVKLAAHITFPYFRSSTFQCHDPLHYLDRSRLNQSREERSAKVLLMLVIIFTFFNSAVSVWFSYLGRDFTEAIGQQKPDLYFSLLTKYAFVVFFVGVPVGALYSYYQEKLALEWRSWLTLRALDMYQSDKR